MLNKNLKGLKSQNLRDYISKAELIFTALSELSTRQVTENNNATGMIENTQAAKVVGNIAKHAKEDIEQRTGTNVVTEKNFLPANKKPKQIKKKD